MRFAVLLTVLLLLSLLQVACKRTQSLEAELAGFEKNWRSGDLICLDQLNLKTVPEESTRWFIQIALQEIEKGIGLSTSKYGDLQLSHYSETGHWTIARITAGERQLSARDLRIGQRIRAVYEGSQPDEESEAQLEIVNYSLPTKTLQLSISVDSSKLNQEVAPATFESIVLSQLSWRLPHDIAIVRQNETRASTTVVGNLNVRYKVSRIDSGYAIRTSALLEELEVDVRPLADISASTNWNGLKLMGQISPTGSNLSDYKYESALGKIPMFEFLNSPAKP